MCREVYFMNKILNVGTNTVDRGSGLKNKEEASIMTSNIKLSLLPNCGYHVTSGPSTVTQKKPSSLYSLFLR